MLGKVFRLVALVTALMGPMVASRALGEPLASFLDGAEERFSPPAFQWFESSQQSLREEVLRVGAILDADGGEDARYWQSHLRWHLLERNLGAPETLVYDELKLVRRWMYSNREGLEGPFFAELRRRMDEYLDAAYTFTQPDLYGQFKQHVMLAREQCQILEENPTDANGAALAKTLGWFEKTRQLPKEVVGIRKQASFPNAQVLVTNTVISDVLAILADDIEQSLSIRDRTQTPPSGLLQRRRTLELSGKASTAGTVGLEMIPNDLVAELSLVYQGSVNALCRADAGPVMLNIATSGTVLSTTPVFVGLDGLRSGSTSVVPNVNTHLAGVSGNSAFLRRVARRRANEPASKRQMRSHARSNAVSMLEEQMQVRVDEALAEIRGELQNTTNSMEGFGDVGAPIQREGVKVEPLGTRSTSEGLFLDVLSGRREHWGAPTPCPFPATNEGVVGRVHVSFLNNAAETIMAGKRFTDRYFMNYAKIFQAELPLPLMVHSRSKRWAMIAANERPLVLEIPSPSRFEFTLNMQGFEYDGEELAIPGMARVAYELVEDEYGEFRLERDGDLTLETELDTLKRVFIHEKLSAFFAPILDAGGVVIPDGGTLGKLSELQVPEIIIDQNWIVVQVTGLDKFFLERRSASQDIEKK